MKLTRLAAALGEAGYRTSAMLQRQIHMSLPVFRRAWRTT